MKKFKYLLLLAFAFIFVVQISANEQVIKTISPNGEIELNVHFLDKLNFTVKYKGEYQLLYTTIGMTLADGQILGNQPALLSQSVQKVSQQLKPLYGKNKVLNDEYQELTINLKDKSTVVFRVYNDAVAYRWITNIKGQIKIKDEEFTCRLNRNVKGWFPNDQSYETTYTLKDASDSEKNRDLFLPLFIEGKHNVKLAFTEAALFNYPSLFLRKSKDEENRLVSSFQRYPSKVEAGGYNNYNMVVKERQDYIAQTQGTREFPWRIVAISDIDADFLNNDIVYKLAKPQVISDVSWIKPGKVVWDWWADYTIENVDFQTGINTKTYLYHVDHAAKYGIEYIIIDWRWTDRDDATMLNPEVDLPQITAYAKSKGVKVIVWVPSYTLHRQLDRALDLFVAQGAAGIKVDFFDRDDQQAINMYEDIAKACAARQLVVDFHGCTKPSGLQRTYPNILNYEAVLGNENNKWANPITPKHKVNLAFIRNFAGPMDFTPGGMRNANKSEFSPRHVMPMIQGTRCSEMALYVIYYEPLKMFCDAVTAYTKELETFQFLTQIPTVWDESKVLDAKIGEYLVVARRSGNTWYIAGITDDSERNLSLDLSFLKSQNTNIEVFVDGVNANHYATDYLHKTITPDLAKPFAVKMVPGGGFVMKVSISQ